MPPLAARNSRCSAPVSTSAAAAALVVRAAVTVRPTELRVVRYFMRYLERAGEVIKAEDLQVRWQHCCEPTETDRAVSGL